MKEHDCTKCVHASKLADHEWECNAKEFDLKGFGCYIPKMTFGDAIEALKKGAKIARRGWNGKGMYLWLLPECRVKKEWCRDERLIECMGEDDEVLCLGSIRMFTHDSTGREAVLTGWLASQSDILSEDWYIVS
jgi:hypothetical protein